MMNATRRLLPALVCLFAANSSPAQAPLVFEDQFERTAGTAELRGAVVVLVYGDRKGTEACRALGEELHVAFHPAAKGLPPAKARLSPVAPLPDAPAGRTGPD